MVCLRTTLEVGAFFGYGSGSRDTDMDLEMQLIKRICLWLRYPTRPNPHGVLFHLPYRRFWQLCSLGKLSQVDNGIALHCCIAALLHCCKLDANSACNIVSWEYVSLHQNKAKVLVHSFSHAVQM